MEKKRVFGELELAILQIFRSNEKLTVREVLEFLRGDDKYTTIMTVMNRMVEKKLLVRQRVGQHYEYWLNEAGQTAQPNFLDKLKQKIFGGKSASMVSYLLESSNDITDVELEKMEKIIHELKESRKQS
ncbi:Uncharacterized protein PHSC3_001836 [Chlamydiales bacterium STE3]|nr:Uncharacterized protein PHSC3_001836 [Chlamydiales bacterium STE3]